jgi:hypothetical protein
MAERPPNVAIRSIVSVEYGGRALLTFTAGREGLDAAQQRMVLAGQLRRSGPSPLASVRSIGRALVALAIRLISTA